MQSTELPRRRELRAAATAKASASHIDSTTAQRKAGSSRKRFFAITAAAAAAVLTAGAIAPTNNATLALWHDTLAIPLAADPNVEFNVPDINTIMPPRLAQDGNVCLYFDEFQTNGIRRAEIVFNFGNLSQFFAGNPTANLNYTAEVRNFSTRGSNNNGGPAVQFRNATVSDPLGSAAANTAVDRTGIFYTSSGNDNHAELGWLVSSRPSGVSRPANNGFNTEPEYINPGIIKTPAGGQNLELNAATAKVVMYAQDRSWQTQPNSAGPFSGYIEPSVLHFTLTGAASTALVNYLSGSESRAATFAAAGITLNNGIITWVGALQTPGFYDNNNHTDISTAGNGLACNNAINNLRIIEPGAPTGLAYVRTGANVNLKWQLPGLGLLRSGLTNAAVNAFQIYHGNYSGAPSPGLTKDSENVTHIASAATSHTVTLPSQYAAAQRYMFVRVGNVAGFGPWSAALDVAAVGTPGAVTSVNAVRDGAQATVTWVAPTSTGNASIVNYQIRWSTQAGSATAIPTTGAVFEATTDGPVLTFTSPATGTGALVAGSSYYFWVRANNGTNYGAWQRSNQITAVGTPGAVTSVNAVRDGAQATVTWVAPTSTGNASIVNYQIRWSTQGGSANAIPTTGTVFEATTDGPVLTFTSPATGTGALVAGSSYYFWVRAYNGTNYGAWQRSNQITAVAVPAKVTGLNWMRSGTSVWLDWVIPDANNSAIQRYEIYWNDTNSIPTPLNADRLVKIEGTLVNNVRVLPAEGKVTVPTATGVYYFWVRAVNSASVDTEGYATGYGPWSDRVVSDGRTQNISVAPSAPTGLSATQGAAGTNGVVNLTWTAVEGYGVNSYEIYFATWPSNGTGTRPTAPTDNVSLTGSNSRTVNADPNVGLGTYQVTGLGTTTWYAFWIRARNAYGASSWAAFPNATQSRVLVSDNLLGQYASDVADQLEQLELEVAGIYVVSEADNDSSFSSELLVADIALIGGYSVVGEEVEVGSLLQLIVAPQSAELEEIIVEEENFDAVDWDTLTSEEIVAKLLSDFVGGPEACVLFDEGALYYLLGSELYAELAYAALYESGYVDGCLVEETFKVVGNPADSYLPKAVIPAPDPVVEEKPTPEPFPYPPSEEVAKAEADYSDLANYKPEEGVE